MSAVAEAPRPLREFGFAARMAGLKPSAIREILKVTERPEVISFAGGLPAPELFPVAGLAQAAQAVFARNGPAALQYGATEGYGPLREWVATYLRTEVGLEAAPEHVLITSGSQQGLDLVARVLLDPGDVVLVDNPSYLGAMQAFRAYEARLVGLPSDREGMRADVLRQFLRSNAGRPKLLYLVPNFQNPTGASLSAARRRALAEVAAEFGVPILEDDPYGSLRYTGAPVPAVCAPPELTQNLYLGTASKILAPGLRVAWLVARDPRLYERLVAAKQSLDLHTSSFTQRMVWEYVSRPGVLAAHVDGLCTAYAERRDTMLAALGRDFPSRCQWTRPEGGLFLWVELPPALDAAALFQAALRREVAFVPGESFWVGPARRPTLRLNFSNASPARIEEGVRRLAAALASLPAGPAGPG